MPDLLDEKIRKANRNHICSYCGGIIHKGEKYDWSKLSYEGELYEWKSHLDCSTVAKELWDYIDPDDGMTGEDFTEGCRAFCDAFCCPECVKCNTVDYDDIECDADNYYCMDKIVERLKTHDFVRIKESDGWTYEWKLVPKSDQ